jgi:hypothetical protein
MEELLTTHPLRNWPHYIAGKPKVQLESVQNCSSFQPDWTCVQAISS